MNEQLLNNPKVGEILKEEFLDEIGMSRDESPKGYRDPYGTSRNEFGVSSRQNALAQAIAVPANRIHSIINGTRRVTADTDLRLCRYFGLSEGYFLRLQNAYELMEAKGKLGQVLVEIQPYIS